MLYATILWLNVILLVMHMLCVIFVAGILGLVIVKISFEPATDVHFHQHILHSLFVPVASLLLT